MAAGDAEMTHGGGSVDKTDAAILDLMKDNARISYQELGDQIGMSRVGAKKRVHLFPSQI